MFSRIVASGSFRKVAVPTFRNRNFSQVVLNGLTPEQIEKISASDNEIRHRHESINMNLTEETLDEVRRKRMIYRSKQRGWLEADLLLGSWATEHVPHLSKQDMDDYDLLLKEETIDIYNYVSGKDPLPDHLKNLKVMKDLQEYALKSKVIDPESYAKLKKEHNLT